MRAAPGPLHLLLFGEPFALSRSAENDGAFSMLYPDSLRSREKVLIFSAVWIRLEV